MEITLDQSLITKAMNDSTTKAVAAALSGYDVHTSITKVVTEEVAHGAVAEAIKKGVAVVDTEHLANHLAKEIQVATTKAVIALLHEGLVSTICKLRGIGDYSQEDKAERARLKVELFG